eukprot:3588959-Alexandrium_andersonii.AAC.1
MSGCLAALRATARTWRGVHATGVRGLKHTASSGAFPLRGARSGAVSDSQAFDACWTFWSLPTVGSLLGSSFGLAGVRRALRSLRG